jgi:hypothetical protein
MNGVLRIEHQSWIARPIRDLTQIKGSDAFASRLAPSSSTKTPSSADQEPPPESGRLTVVAHLLAVLNATSKAEVDAAYDSLIRHPHYSSAAFSGGKLISYELRNGARGISAELTGEGR